MDAALIHDAGAGADAADAGAPADAGHDASDGEWGPRDAGCSASSCAIGERCADGACRCGAGSACGFPSSYCYDGACIPRPTLVVHTAEAERCADLGLAYSPPLFLRRIGVQGRPGASGILETIRRGCPPFSSSSAFVLDASGSFVETVSPPDASSDCTDDGIGLYQYRAVVDGVVTEWSEGTFYNSGCPRAATCALAAELRACAM